jgi:hypothetical protein
MHTVDELLERHERHIRHTVRRSWFQRGMYVTVISSHKNKHIFLTLVSLTRFLEIIKYKLGTILLQI